MSAAVVSPVATPVWVDPAPSHGSRVVLPGQTPQGGEVLSVLLKRSYQIEPDGVCPRAREDQPLNPGEVFWDTPMNSSVRMESDFVPYKLQTDVVLIGRVHAPGGRPTERCTAQLQVGERLKTIQVTGNRWAQYVAKDRDPVFSDPEPFVEIDLLYERAYGGIDVYSDTSRPLPYPRNPLGSGFVVANTPEALREALLPNFEDPRDSLTPPRLCIGDYARWVDQPHPVGFGWYPKTWQPRCQLAGVLPADRATERELREAYAQLVPSDQRAAFRENGLPDMDFRFFNGASAGLSMPFLQGGEPVKTENLSPEGRLDFLLPSDAPKIGIDIGSGVDAPEVVLQTVQIRMEDRELDLVWRAAVPYPGRDWLPQMRKLQVLVG